jgi:ketosteroid isomerase-like protein
MFTNLKTVFPDGMKVVVDHMIAEGDYVAVEAHADCKLANGKNYENRYHLKFELKDGKVLNWRHYDDTLYFKEIILDGK